MMNLPNILTLSRFVFALVIGLFILQHTLTGYLLASGLFLLAALTDLYDGFLARQMKLTTSFGKIMDPIADKALMLSVFAVLAVFPDLVAPWMVIVIAVREIWITADRLVVMREGRVIAAERSGKIKTVLQMSSVGVILLYLIAKELGWFVSIQPAWLIVIKVMMIATVMITITSGIEYFKAKRQAV